MENHDVSTSRNRRSKHGRRKETTVKQHHVRPGRIGLLPFLPIVIRRVVACESMGHQKCREIARYRRVGGIGQAKILKTRPSCVRACPSGRLAARNLRPVAAALPVRETTICNPPPITFDPAAGRLTVSDSGASELSSVSFTRRAVRTSVSHCRSGELVVAREAPLDMSREGQIKIIAPQNQMLAHRDTMKLHVAGRFAGPHADQREVGSAAANVAHQYLLTRRNLLLPVLFMPLEPRIKRCLRFFDQRHARQAARLAASTVSSRATSSKEAGRVRTTSCSANRCCGNLWSQAARTCCKYRDDASTGDRRSTSASPCQGSNSAVRSTPE